MKGTRARTSAKACARPVRAGAPSNGPAAVSTTRSPSTTPQASPDPASNRIHRIRVPSRFGL